MTALPRRRPILAVVAVLAVTLLILASCGPSAGDADRRDAVLTDVGRYTGHVSYEEPHRGIFFADHRYSDAKVSAGLHTGHPELPGAALCAVAVQILASDGWRVDEGCRHDGGIGDDADLSKDYHGFTVSAFVTAHPFSTEAPKMRPGDVWLQVDIPSVQNDQPNIAPG